MAGDLATQYFTAIKEVWSPFEVAHRTIPFCTPVIANPTVIVVGTNHSDFVDGGGAHSEKIADQYASQIARESTFLVHDHKFARGLNEVCSRADISIDKSWVGTNRCAVQTGPDGIDEIERHKNFDRCQASMDRLLRSFVHDSRPANLLLVGKYAIELFYDGARSRTFEALLARVETIPDCDEEIQIIPIPHPSRAGYWQDAADRLSEHFVR